MARGFLGDHRGDYVAAVGFPRRIDQYLAEKVALGVAATEQTDLVEAGV